MSVAPCKGCEHRHSACWDTCEAYNDWHDQNVRNKVEAKGKMPPHISQSSFLTRSPKPTYRLNRKTRRT